MIRVLARTFENLGGTIYFNREIEHIDEYLVTLNGIKIPFNLVINCAGTRAIKFAHEMGVGVDLAQLPFIGLYKFTNHENLPLKALVYPLPDTDYPFLGVHFTISIDGKTKVGPTAIPVIGAEQYQFLNGISFEDLHQLSQSITALARKNLAQTLKLAKLEMPNLYTKNLISKAAELVPSSSSIEVWRKYRPGIRAQLIKTDSGNFLQDFRIDKTTSVLHVLNSVSPGWTSAIPFGRWLANQSLELLG